MMEQRLPDGGGWKKHHVHTVVSGERVAKGYENGSWGLLPDRPEMAKDYISPDLLRMVHKKQQKELFREMELSGYQDIFGITYNRPAFDSDKMACVVTCSAWMR